jgi:hypothetical protein
LRDRVTEAGCARARRRRGPLLRAMMRPSVTTIGHESPRRSSRPPEEEPRRAGEQEQALLGCRRASR